MATVNKNFRIKNGLVVEGSTATVNGQNILTETGGDSYILNLVGGAALVKSTSSDFTVTGAGELQIKSSSDLARTGDITSAINNLDTDAIEEGSSNLYFTDQRVTDVINNIAGVGLDYAAGQLDVQLGTGLNTSANQIQIDRSTVDGWYDAAGAATSAQTAAENYAYGVAAQAQSAAEGYASGVAAQAQSAAEGYASGVAAQAQSAAESYAYGVAAQAQSAAEGYASGVAAQAQSAAESYADGLASNYEAAGAVSQAYSSLQSYIANSIDDLSTDDIEEGINNKYFTDSSAVNAVTNVLGSGLTVSAGQIVVDTNSIATQSYVNTAIDNLVDGAPGLLDTLNEIAAAINDDANYFTTIANEIAGKQNTLTAGSNISIDGSNVISVTGLDTDDVAEGTNLYFTDTRARDAMDGEMPSFSSVLLGGDSQAWHAQQFAWATVTNGTNEQEVYFWDSSMYKSIEFIIQYSYGTHTEISKILATIDTSHNVHMTEYGNVSTNGSLGTTTIIDIFDKGAYTGKIMTTPVSSGTTARIVGTLLK